MKETLVNGYLKIELVEHTTFISTDKTSYEEVGVVLAKDEAILNIPLGAKVFFDSFMAKKYPKTGEDGKFEYFIHYDEVVKYEV